MYLRSLAPARRMMLIAMMLGGTASQGVVFGAIPPLLTSISTHYGGGAAGELISQLSVSAPALGLMTGGLLSGWAIARSGIRRVVFAAVIAFGLAGTAPVWLDDPVSLLAGRLLTGLAAACLTTASAALIAEYCVEDDRARILGYQSALTSAAGVLSLFLSAFIAEHLGWQLSFTMYGVVAAALYADARIALAPLQLPKPQEVALDPRKLRAVWSIYLTAAFSAASIALATNQLPFVLQEDGVTAPQSQAVVLAMFSIALTISSGIFAYIRRLIGSENVLSAALAALGTGLCLIGSTHMPISAGMGAALVGCSCGMTVPHFWSLTMMRAPTESRGLALGLLSTALYIGNFSNPFAMAFLQMFVGRHAAFVIVGIAVLVVLLSFRMLDYMTPGRSLARTNEHRAIANDSVATKETDR